MSIARIAVAAVAAGALAIGLGAPVLAAPSEITITMSPLSNSGESGTATLTQQSDGVKVVVSLKNAPAAAQPTHIHIGTCGSIKAAPEYALISLANGTSTTVVKGVTLDQLLAGKYAINVHKSADDLATYVACGNIAAS